MLSFQKHQPREHWRALRQLGGILPSDTIASAAASAVVTPAGAVLTSPADIRQVWLDFWAGLAKELQSDPRFDADFQQETLHELAAEEHIEEENSRPRPCTQSQAFADSILNAPLTLNDVEQSVHELKNNKAPGCDGIVGEVLKHGGASMSQALYRLCNFAFDSGTVPLDWMRGMMVPIPKEGDPRQPAHHRPITLLSIVAKVYTGILQSRMSRWSEAAGVIVPEQGGFRPGRGCVKQLFTLTELIKIRRLRKQKTYACFLDIKKAYDTVWHAGLRLRPRHRNHPVYGWETRVHACGSTRAHVCGDLQSLRGL